MTMKRCYRCRVTKPLVEFAGLLRDDATTLMAVIEYLKNPPMTHSEEIREVS